MSYGNSYFCGRLHLLLFLFPLFLEVVRAGTPTVSASYQYSGLWGANGTLATETVAAAVHSVWVESTRTLNCSWNVTFVDSAGTTRGGMECGWQKRIAGVVNAEEHEVHKRFSNGSGTFSTTLPAGAEIRLWVRCYVSDVDSSSVYDSYRYSGWFSGEALQYRRLDFTVTNPSDNPEGRSIAGVWAATEDGAVYCDVVSADKVVAIDPGASAVVTFHTRIDDAALYYAGVLSDSASRALFGGLPLQSQYERVDGSPAFGLSGAVALAASKTATKAGITGVTVTLVAYQEGSGFVPKPGLGTPIGGAPGTVPDGSTGPATGKEVTDAANAQIGQAHADAQALQRSVDNVGAKIDALGNKLGTGTGSGSGDSERATAAADAAQATKDSMGDGTSAANDAAGFAQGHGETMRTNAASAVGQFGTSPTIAEENGTEPLEKITIKIY